MGGAEVYCAICGGPVNVPFWEDGDEEEYTYDLTVVQEDRLDLEWLKDVRVIGEDPASTGLSRIWVSGVASHDEHGYFDLEEGDPVMELFEEDSLRTYAYKGHDSFAVPYHQTCRTLLSKYLNVGNDDIDNDGNDDTEDDGSDGIDNDMFFQVLRQSADTSEYAQALKLDYGSVSKNQEQYWVVSRGDEHFVHSPLDIPWLERYLVRIPWMEHERPMHYAPEIGQYDYASDRLSTLPIELRWSILLHLDMRSLMFLFFTCKTLYATQQSSSWWRRKLLVDMPWLFEVASIEAVVTEEWARVYKDMWLASRYTPSAHKITGLANRRRIWEEILPQIAGPYEKLQEENARDLPDILRGASSTGLQRLISPEPEVNSSFRYYFAQSIAGLKDARIEFHVHLDQDQFIRGLHFAEGQQSSAQGDPTQDAFNFPTTVESVQVPANDCLAGIIVTSREIPEGEEGSRKIVGLEFLLGSSTSQLVGSTNGDKRLIHVSKGKIAVGVETFSSPEGGLSRLSLLQQPALLARGIDRLSSQGSTPDHVNLEAAKFLWRKQIPPPGVQISEHHAGYWSYAMEKDLSPMEPLIFGTTNAELADITAIAIDVLFGGIEVRYGSRPTRSIGPRNLAMKTLTIDGQGGERVVALNYVVNYIPMGIRIVTNYGRQLVVGQASRRQEELVQYPPQDSETKQFAHLVGMYGFWSSRETPKSRLEAVGCLFAAEMGDQHAPEMPNLASGQSRIWEPSAPSGVEEIGPILGDFSVKESLGINSRTLEVLDRCPTVSWIDCSRPLLEVRVTLCHSFEEKQVPLSAITFRYADGAKEEVTIGPEVHSQSPIDIQGIDNDWCWCSLSGRKAEDELSIHPHYKRHMWELGGKRLQSVRVFLSPIDEEVGRGSRLAGIQFIAEDGSESPKWSHWNFSSDDAYVIENISFKDERIGLKLFMGETRRSVTYEDSIVYALQAMARLD
ncbi:unnamed protein product [Clonostachys rhizophaga]|uniref:F-box domain-containing protein n=1 Tax=Clonostachys rhizophaga TaxID=160324 RepID=A0A9N9VGM1_9HYPO|nr:unnamed protein product [Clonostachys rhizophaga]